MLVHAKDRELRLYLGRATVAARWRPADGLGRVAREERPQREGIGAVKDGGATRGCHEE